MYFIFQTISINTDNSILSIGDQTIQFWNLWRQNFFEEIGKVKKYEYKLM